MKTSQEWFEIRRIQINETRNASPSKEFYEQIQLDSFKAGLDKAIEIIQSYANCMRGSHVNTNDSCGLLKRELRDIRDNLTKL